MQTTSSATWEVPREWKGERCYIIAGGPSVKELAWAIPKMKGRVIAIKQSVYLKPDADVMFIAGKDDPKVCANFFPMHTGKYLIARSTYEGAPERCKFLQRDITNPGRLSLRRTHLSGYDAGTSAINLAFHFGSREIILLGYDMTGGRWFNDTFDHHMPTPPQQHFDIHMSILPTFARDLKNHGASVVNVSPLTKVKQFPLGMIEDYL